jgi:hypothetical protein
MIEPLVDLTVQRAITEALVVDDKREEEKRVFIFKIYNYYASASFFDSQNKLINILIHQYSLLTHFFLPE